MSDYWSEKADAWLRDIKGQAFDGQTKFLANELAKSVKHADALKAKLAVAEKALELIADVTSVDRFDVNGNYQTTLGKADIAEEALEEIRK